jgi:7-cyano-7-deazaguanine synthase
MVDVEGEPQHSGVLLLAGGGIDSTACLQQLRDQNFDVRLVHVNFGQAAANEEWAVVRRVATFFDAEATQIVVIGPETFAGGEIVGRNAFLIFTALVFLRPVEKLICIGIHSGTSFFDCSQAFLGEIAPLVASITEGVEFH